MEQSPMLYQHVEPALMGNEKRMLVSELSGHQNILGKFRDEGFVDYPDNDPVEEHASAILSHVKHLKREVGTCKWDGEFYG
eukprot:4986241-Ditylum_brightwellii.AAC.1